MFGQLYRNKFVHTRLLLEHFTLPNLQNMYFIFCGFVVDAEGVGSGSSLNFFHVGMSSLENFSQMCPSGWALPNDQIQETRLNYVGKLIGFNNLD
jgi:hypothetical protein